MTLSNIAIRSPAGNAHRVLLGTIRSENREALYESSVDGYTIRRVRAKLPSIALSVIRNFRGQRSLAELASVDPEELGRLGGKERLEGLDLKDTQVSDEQVQELRQALPNCEIFY